MSDRKPVMIHSDSHTALKVVATLQGRSMQDCVEEAVRDWLDKVRQTETNPELSMS